MGLKDRKRILNRYQAGKSITFQPRSIYDPIYNGAGPMTPFFDQNSLLKETSQALTSSIPTVTNINNSPITNTNNNTQTNKYGNILQNVKGALDTTMNYAPQLLQFGGQVANAFGGVKSQNELLGEAGSSTGTIDGISYEKQNSVDSEGNMKQLKAENTSNTLGLAASGASIGNSIGGPIGAVAGGLIGGIAGLFGGSSREEKLKRRIREAQQYTGRLNQYNRSGAQSDALYRNYYLNNDSNQDKMIYANSGKDNNVWSPYGYHKGPINSMVGKGESILNLQDETATYVSKGKRGVDNQPSSVRQDDDNIILGNDIDWSNGVKFSDQAAPYTMKLQYINKLRDKSGRYDKLSSLSQKTKDVQNREIDKYKQPIMDNLRNISNRQKIQHEIQNRYETYGYDSGKNSYLFPAIAGIGAALNQYSTYNNQPIRYHNTYRENPYQAEALAGLARNRYNIYPELDAIRRISRMGQYSINNSGGLSGAQRYLGRIANILGTQQNISKVYNTAQEANMNARQNYYTQLLNAGAKDQSNRMQAAQHDWADYVASHGAKYKNRDIAISNMLNQINSAYANKFKYDTWKDTADLYRQRLNDEQLEKLAQLEGARGVSTRNTMPTFTKTYSSETSPFGLDLSFKNLIKLYK